MTARVLLVLAAAAVAAAPARAQPADQPAVESGAQAEAAEAQRRFQHGVELYKEGDLGAAHVEFKRAYELVPNYKILYNLAQVAFQRRDYAGALHYFRRYLGDGDSAIPVERQNEVAGEILRLGPRVGTLEIQTPEIGADVFVDDVRVGTTPLAGPIEVNAGVRRVVVVARTGEHLSRQVDVAGREAVRAAFPRLALPLPPPGPARPNTAAVATPSDDARPTLLTAAASPSPAPSPRTSRFPWKSWVVTGLLAGGAAATGVIAWRAKQNLDTELAKFPSDPIEVDFYDRRTRGFALATDGLLIGTSIMTAVSLYFTFRNPR